MKNIIEIKQNIDLIAQDDILIKGTEILPGKVHIKNNMVYFFSYMKKLRQICPLYELLSMNKDFGSKKHMRYNFC